MAVGVSETEVHESVQARIDRADIQKIVGKPTKATLDTLELEVGRALAGIRTDQWGGTLGHLPLLINDAKLQTLTGDQAATVTKMQKPGVLPPALNASTSATLKTQLLAQHRVDQNNYTTMIVTEEVVVNTICTKLVDEMYVVGMEDEYMGYKNKTIKQVFKHIREDFIAVTTLEKDTALKNLARQWVRANEHVSLYIRHLDKAQKKCLDVGAAADDKTKVHYFVTSMYATDLFDEKEMMEYEAKTEANKTWDLTKKYFVPLIKVKDKFAEEQLARRGGYESANSFSDVGSTTSNGTSFPPSNINPSDLGTFDRTSMTEYTNELEGIVTDKQEEIAALTTSNEQLLKAMEAQQQQQMKAMETMQKNMMDMFTKLATGQQVLCQPTAPATNTGGGGDGQRKRVAPRYCNVCKKPRQVHEDDDCWEKLPEEKQPQWFRDMKKRNKGKKDRE